MANVSLTLTSATPLNVIAEAIERDWPKVNFAARPYLDAMHALRSVSDDYGMDRGDMIVAYFLSNASGYRGETARAIKAELRRRIA
jgi:hypothetical protein